MKTVSIPGRLCLPDHLFGCAHVRTFHPSLGGTHFHVVVSNSNGDELACLHHEKEADAQHVLQQIEAQVGA